jgi:acyl dehydratase
MEEKMDTVTRLPCKAIGTEYRQTFTFDAQLMDNLGRYIGTHRLHNDDEFAKTTHFKKRVVSGLHLWSCAITAFHAMYGDKFGSRAQYSEFEKFVFAGETVEVVLIVAEKISKRRDRLRVEIVNAHGVRVLVGWITSEQILP